MNKFKVGDRVRVYSFWVSGGYGHRDGDVVTVQENGLRVKLSNWTEVSAHPKQCRRLVPKKKKEMWMNEYNGFHGSPHASIEDADAHAIGKHRTALHRVRIIETIKFDGEGK